MQGREIVTFQHKWHWRSMQRETSEDLSPTVIKREIIYKSGEIQCEYYNLKKKKEIKIIQYLHTPSFNLAMVT